MGAALAELPDTLAAMLRKGTITPAMARAGAQFHGDFARAALDPLRAADWGRVVGAGGAGEGASLGQVAARERVWAALVMLGGMASPAGSCAWHVLGLGASLRDWSIREGWRGRPLNPHTAAGILLGALGALAGYYEG